MNTYFLGKEEINGYLLDFLDRLSEAESKPTVWCPVTDSGEALVEALVDLVKAKYPKLLEVVQVVSIDVANGSDKIIFRGKNPAKILKGKSVLLLDGAIHSGRMMSHCAAAILRYKPKELTSYSLVIKRCSKFIPTLWGVMMDETDRAYFMLDSLPNNRLDVGTRPLPPVQMRILDKSHLSQPIIKSGVGSMDRMRWSDRLFQMEASEGHTCTYILERAGRIVGFLTIHPLNTHGLAIDEIVVDPKQQGKGYGGILLRFADNIGRQSNCHIIRLNAIEEKVDFYKGFDYLECSDRAPLFIDEEKYIPMHRKVLYHQPRPSSHNH